MTETVYVKLLNEGSDAWRPTQAEVIKPKTYKLLPTENYDPEDEEWEFLPGTIVKCEKQIKSGQFGKHKEILVVVGEDGASLGK